MNEIMYFLAGLFAGVLLYKLIKPKKERRDDKVDHRVRALLCCVPMTRKQYLDYFKPDQE